MKETIPLKIKPYLEEIADRLSANHASVMIGAGFSKNARKGESMKKLSPSWHELGDCFYRKVYGKSPNDSDRCYLDVLKLAEEVEATYGRSTLEKLLKSEIPDKELQPSKLHTALLNLPWTDVFTTNYDTLLERAATTVLDRRYETIVNKKDIVWSQKPRIIKLHGTFPSDRPFIITEEDYRKYPKDFAPFVNTVQQSLLENTLCLLGFSGNDPNFTKWIGWIRDNLGKENSPKIFLIGFLTLSAGQIKLMEERNIVPVDLSCWCDDADNHYDALMAFVEFLSEAIRTKGQKLSWAKTSHYNHSLDINKELLPQYESIISSWRQERLDYPNWLILPRDQRKILREATESSYALIYHLGKVSAPTNLRFLFEFNWRLEKYLFPIYNEWTEYYEQVLDKYNPFSNISSEKTDTLTPNNKDGKKIKEWEELSLYWIELKLSLLRFYREEGFNDKWTSLSVEFENIYKHLSSVHKARYHYERCLFFQFQFDIALLREELEKWKSDISIPYWEAKRAMILAELGDLNDAERILEASLREIRSQLNFYTTITDYLLVSQEAYLLQLLKYVNHANSRIVSKKPIRKYEEYSDRWNKLLQYKCDPWGELQLFEANVIEGDSSKYNSEEITYGFEIGAYKRAWKFDSYNKAAQEAYMFLRYIEETGLALNISGVAFGKEVAQKAIDTVSGYSSIWAYSTLIRTGEKKIIDSIFDRRSLSLMTREYVETIAKNYLAILDKYAPVYSSYRSKNDVFATSLTTIIPEILSRLCFKCSYKTRLAMFDMAKKIYIADNHEAAGDGMRKLLEKIVKSFTPEEQWDAILQQIVEFPIVINPYDRNADVFTALRIDNDTKKNNRVSVKAHVVARLLA